MASTERWLFDGWELTNKTAVGWAHRDGTNEASGFVGENTQVPSRGGELWRAKVQGPGRFALDIWVKGADAVEVEANWRLILRAMRRRHRLVVVDRYMPDGERIRCNAEVIGTIAPQHLSQRVWRASVTFNIPDGVWRSYDTYTGQSVLGTQSFTDRTIMCPGLEPSTEGNDELVLTFTGPGTNWYLKDWTDGGVGDWVRYNGAIPAGCSLILNCKTWAVTYAGSWTPNLAAIQYPQARYMSFPPPRPGYTPQARLTIESGGTAASFCKIEGPRVYAC